MAGEDAAKQLATAIARQYDGVALVDLTTLEQNVLRLAAHHTKVFVDHDGGGSVRVPQTFIDLDNSWVRYPWK